MSKVTAVSINVYSGEGIAKKFRFGASVTGTSEFQEAAGAVTEWRGFALGSTWLGILNASTSKEAVERLEGVKFILEKLSATGHAQAYEVYMAVTVEGHDPINIFVNTVTLNEWGVEGGGTATEAVNKTAVSPTAPSISKFLESPTTEKTKVEGTFTIPALLREQIENIKLIGELTVGASTDSLAAAHAEAFIFTATGTGTLKAMTIRTTGTASTATSIKMGVYADSGGKPGTRLGQGTLASKPGTNSWAEVTGLSVSVTSGVKYHLAPLALGGTLSFFLKTGGTTGDIVSQGGLTELPEVFKSEETFADGPCSIVGWGLEEVEGASLMAMMA